MFGDFMQNFGLSGLPWDTIDTQGGLFGPNAPTQPLIGSQNAGTAPVSFAPQSPMAAPGGGGPSSGATLNPNGPAPPVGGPPAAGPGSPMAPGGASPLANPASFGGGPPAQNQPAAPAAGVGNQFGPVT